MFFNWNFIYTIMENTFLFNFGIGVVFIGRIFLVCSDILIKIDPELTDLLSMFDSYKLLIFKFLGCSTFMMFYCYKWFYAIYKNKNLQQLFLIRVGKFYNRLHKRRFLRCIILLKHYCRNLGLVILVVIGFLVYIIYYTTNNYFS